MLAPQAHECYDGLAADPLLLVISVILDARLEASQGDETARAWLEQLAIDLWGSLSPRRINRLATCPPKMRPVSSRARSTQRDAHAALP